MKAEMIMTQPAKLHNKGLIFNGQEETIKKRGEKCRGNEPFEAEW
jgi:hypothetical protein